MPLTKSPIDGSPMRKVVRHGVEVDVCQSSGGVWLDKGELEKLTQIIREDTLAEAEYGHGRGSRFDDDEEDFDTRPSGRRRSRLSDFFDF